MNDYDVAVIGGGPAGMAAAISAFNEGSKVLLIEREDRLGGVLKQCIHDGFGVIRFGEKLSGCEYACRYIKTIRENTDVKIETLTFVSRIEKAQHGFVLHLTNRDGIQVKSCTSLILATGCRERTARQVQIHGTRPAGILTAGAAQYYINVLGQLPGKKCVILGSGDIGLIMARRLTLEGVEVLGVYEAKPEPSGLSRNIYQCLVDFNIPLYLSHTVTEVHGRSRVCGVTIAEVDSKMNPILGTEKYIECDTCILSVGLIPENELTESLGASIYTRTKGAYCDENYMTSEPGLYSCGNALHVNDLVDYVSESGERAGKAAAIFSKGKSIEEHQDICRITTTKDFLYCVPQRLSKQVLEESKVDIFFRTKETREATKVKVMLGNQEVFVKRYQGLRPPEMEKISINLKPWKEKLASGLTLIMEEE